MQKLKLLVANNKMLVAYYSTLPEQYRCLRMQGVTQSYDQFDSAAFVAAKQMKNILDQRAYKSKRAKSRQSSR